MLMDLIQKALDAIKGKPVHDALHRVERMERRQQEVKKELSEVKERTDRLHELVRDMRGPP